MHIKNFDPYEFSKKEIEGVPVYYKNLPWAPCIHINIVFNTGAFNDPVGKEGISHFLEHMIFNGSPLIKDKKSVKEWSKLNALNTWNAWTGYYQTNYHLQCLPEKYEEVIKGMKDMIFYPYLRAEDVEHERKVITQEAWGRLQNQKFLSYVKDVWNNLYHGHIRSRFYTALGWPETIASIHHEDIETWHKENYAKGNFYIVMVGAVESNHVESLSHFLKDLPVKAFAKRKEETVLKPLKNRYVKTADEIGEVKEQVEISFIRFATFFSQEYVGPVAAFRRLLSDLLHERLRIENSLCYSIRIHTELRENFSEFYMNMKTEEKNIELVEKEFWRTINEITDGLHKDRFEVLKQLSLDQMRSQELMSEDIADTTLRRISLWDGKINTLKESIDLMKKVTYQEVASLSKEIFDPEYVFTEIILPSKKEEEAAHAAS